MIYIEQSEKLLQAFEKLKESNTIRAGNVSSLNGNMIIDERSFVKTALLDKDKIKVGLEISFEGLAGKKEKTIFACIINKAMKECQTKSVSHSISSCYSAPTKIESLYKYLKPKLGQQKAMQECVGINVEGKPFSWRDARLMGFVAEISITKELNGFDIRQIEGQKSQLSNQLSKLLSYHIDNTLKAYNRVLSPTELGSDSELNLGV
tara:strand:- start:123 stop:743 length:621 start_codon:yes stop_codon:yes gene_type:complete